MNEKQQIQKAIFELLSSRSKGATICPSEAARQVYAADEWREKMDLVREVGKALSADGRLEVCQKGERVNPSEAKGPIRYRLRAEKI